MYLQAKVNPLYITRKFRVDRDKSIELTPPMERIDDDVIEKEYIFVHDDPEKTDT